MGGGKKRKRGQAVSEEDTKKALCESKNTLCVSGLPGFTTKDHIRRFFGTMLDSHMQNNENLTKTLPPQKELFKKCYVRFEDETQALEALKKDKQTLLGCEVRVEVSKVTLRKVRAKKSYCTIRQLPYAYDLGKKGKKLIKAMVREEYNLILRGDFISEIKVRRNGPESPANPKSQRHRYALVTFVNKKKAKAAMQDYEANLPQLKTTIGQTKALLNHIATCEIQKFWH